MAEQTKRGLSASSVPLPRYTTATGLAPSVRLVASVVECTRCGAQWTVNSAHHVTTVLGHRCTR